MIHRMLVRAARDGAQALAWAGAPLDLARLAAGAGGRGRARFAERAELGAVPAEVPVALAQIHRAFAGDADRGPALVAMFLETGRRAEALVEQLELAGQADAALAPAARALAARSRARGCDRSRRASARSPTSIACAPPATSTASPAGSSRSPAPASPGRATCSKADVIVSESSSMSGAGPMTFKIGIDLGTTNSVVAYMKGKRPAVLRTLEGIDWTPSVIQYVGGKFVVGKRARDNLAEAPQGTVAWSVKRFIGRMPNDENVKRAKQLVSYSVEPPPPGGEELVIKLAGKPFTPVELSAEILKHHRRRRREVAAPAADATP